MRARQPSAMITAMTMTSNLAFRWLCPHRDVVQEGRMFICMNCGARLMYHQAQGRRRAIRQRSRL